ncbi:hypothetical protein C0Q70_03291 [Pomacea canaliculata]|uniref:Sushi domain-containing protein n=1 Tax=Pomacea canaliculata TaxID=400727 RepID=A0A2T7PSA9_POMCA|nr:hypothetical protein C0Q70_03291 [Pomacea canaliculata]
MYEIKLFLKITTENLSGGAQNADHITLLVAVAVESQYEYSFLHPPETSQCQDPQPVPNAYRHFNQNGDVIYSCYYGYQMTSGSSQLACKTISTTTRLVQICTLVCGTPASYVDQTVNYTDNTGDSLARYACKSDYSSSNNTFARETEAFSESLPKAVDEDESTCEPLTRDPGDWTIDVDLQNASAVDIYRIVMNIQDVSPGDAKRLSLCHVEIFGRPFSVVVKHLIFKQTTQTSLLESVTTSGTSDDKPYLHDDNSSTCVSLQSGTNTFVVTLDYDVEVHYVTVTTSGGTVTNVTTVTSPQGSVKTCVPVSSYLPQTFVMSCALYLGVSNSVRQRHFNSAASATASAAANICEIRVLGANYTNKDNSLQEAQNYCRNPVTYAEVRPWCYISATETGYCPVITCATVLTVYEEPEAQKMTLSVCLPSNSTNSVSLMDVADPLRRPCSTQGTTRPVRLCVRDTEIAAVRIWCAVNVSTCSSPPAIPRLMIVNETIANSSYMVGDVVTYTCAKGFYVQGGLANSTCGFDFQFRMNSSLICSGTCAATTRLSNPI